MRLVVVKTAKIEKANHYKINFTILVAEMMSF